MCTFTQAATIFARLQLIICTLSVVAGFSIFASEFVSDLEKGLLDLNKESTKNKLAGRKFDVSAKMMAEFIDFIKFDAQAKELSIEFWAIAVSPRILKRLLLFFRFINYFSVVNSGIIFLYLTFVVVSLSSLLLQINMVKYSKSTIFNVVFVDNIIVVIFFISYSKFITILALYRLWFQQ